MTKSVRDGFFCLGTDCTDLLPTKNRRVTTQERTFKKSLHTSRSATGEHTAPPPPRVAFVASGVAPSIARDDSKVFPPDFHHFARVHASPASPASTITTILVPQSPPRLRARRRSRMHDRVRSFVRSLARRVPPRARIHTNPHLARTRVRLPARRSVRPRARARVPPAPPRDARVAAVQPWSVAAARRALFRDFATLFRAFSRFFTPFSHFSGAIFVFRVSSRADCLTVCAYAVVRARVAAPRQPAGDPAVGAGRCGRPRVGGGGTERKTRVDGPPTRDDGTRRGGDDGSGDGRAE